MTTRTVSSIVKKYPKIAAVVAGVSALGVIGASAATLGGVTSNSLGSDVGVVSSCDTDGVSLAYTNAYDAKLGRYQTTSVTVSGIAPACAGKSLSLTLKDAGGASLGGGTVASISGASAVLNLTAPGADANAVVGAAVVITG